MPSQLQVANEVLSGVKLIEAAASEKLITAKIIKKGTLLPRWDISHSNEWNNTLGGFDMQSYLHEYLQQFSLDFTINGNNQIEVISWP